MWPIAAGELAVLLLNVSVDVEANTSSMGNGRNANNRRIHISSACIGVLASLIPSRACTTIS